MIAVTSTSKPQHETTSTIKIDEHSAFHSALGIRCRDSDDEVSDESSVESESDSDVDEHMAGTSIRLITSLPPHEDDHDDESVETALRAIRIPESFSSDLALVMDRHRKVSTASQRSRQSHEVIPHTAVEKDGKSKDRPRPSPILFNPLQNTAPRIEIEQVFDDGSAESGSDIDDKVDVHKRQSLDLEKVNVSPASKRSAARTRMMQAIGRNRKAPLRRSESMDEVIATPPSSTASSSFNVSIVPTESTSSPQPRTPGTAFHQRSVSCPSPKVPQLHQFGDFSVIVTPPTPRPQGSPIIGVFIRGVHKTPVATRYCACSFGFNPLLPQEYGSSAVTGMACAQCKEDASLKVPEFEMAPGRTKMQQQQRQQALALIAWQRSQQQMANAEWCLRVKQDEVRLNRSDRERSIRHIVSSAHRRTPSPTSSGSESPSWRREPASAPMSWTGSSASMYSQESSSSAADSAASWRSKAPTSPPRSAPPSSCSVGGKYLPPAKRSGGLRSYNALKSRKEGCAARTTVASTMSNASPVSHMPERERAAQTMLARLQSRNGSNPQLSA